MNRYNKNNSMVGQSKRDATRLIAGGVIFVAEQQRGADCRKHLWGS
ncbi:hypothetical protein GOD90_10790 [Sinorhizobium medicae]|nr:hypothetical protein [Sinorhizobium medicae]